MEGGPMPLQRLGRRQQDAITHRVLATLKEAGFFPAPVPEADLEAFHQFRRQVRATFHVPETSITPLMARLLFGIAHVQNPNRIVGVGTYAGNSLVWLAGPTLMGLGRAVEVLGVDIDPAATSLAQANFAALAPGPSPIRLVTGDARQPERFVCGKVDLLYIDVDDPENGKRLYRPVLEAFLPYLAPGALVLAHDICEVKFEQDLEPYRALVRDRGRFRRTVTLKVDPFGLEVSQVL